MIQPLFKLDDLYEAINATRRRFSLSECERSLPLEIAAEKHVFDMWWNDFVSHIGSDGSTYISRGKKYGSILNPTGEIIQKGPGGKDAIPSVIRNWMNSVGHKNIILDPTARYFGGWYRLKNEAVKGNYWVVLFAN